MNDEERYSRLTLDFAQSLHGGCALLSESHEIFECPIQEYVIKNAQGHMKFLASRGHIVNEQKVAEGFLAIGLEEQSKDLELINKFLDVITEEPPRG